MVSVDVVILTKNSERMLDECLRAVYRNVPVGHLIIVDGHSTDGTMDIIERFNKKYHNVMVVQDNGTRATARQKGIKHVTTEWFMFVDSDVVLCEEWYRKAANFINDDVGAIWGIEVWSTIQNPFILKFFLWLTLKIFDIRGGTHDTLMRTKAVSDIMIPKNLHVFEDAYIKNWITQKGYKVVACYNPFCVHYRPKSVWTLRGSLDLILESVRIGSFKLLTKLVPAYSFYTLYTIYQFIMQHKHKRRNFKK
ncbi:MAG: glycosyltransferase family 2 protein [Candidatus Bathyarchaeia archaeon]